MAKLAILLLSATAWFITSLIAFGAGLHQALAVFPGLIPAVAITAILWWFLYAGFNISMPWWLILFCVLLGAGTWQKGVEEDVFRKRMLDR